MNEQKTLDPLTCQEAVERLFAYLDKELSPDEEAAVRRHLELCEPCFRHFQFDERLLTTIQEKCRTGRAPAELRRKVSDLLDQL